MSSCKDALEESSGDLEIARDWLRARGAVIAEEKAGRKTTEGLIVVIKDGKNAAIVEILAETDFVANNRTFRDFAQQVADAALAAGKDVAWDSCKIGNQTVEELRAEVTLKIGENIQLGRSHYMSAAAHLATYVHHDGKIGVLADIQGDLSAEQRKQICMHIASMKPECLSKENFDPVKLERQRKAFAEVAATSDKPRNVQEKIAEGKLAKFIAGKALLQQDYAWEDNICVGKFLEKNNAKIHSFILLLLGN